MADTLRRSSFRKFWHTPFSDLLRGRITGRMDVQHRLRVAQIPPEAATIVLRIAKRTRLWRAERADVAAELAAHFADGLESGEKLEDLIADFGDEREAAKLIRRAKIRNRPLAWHILRNARRVVLVLLLIYGVQLVRYYVGKPTISVDYLVQLNADVNKTPVDQRAWPVYAQALIQLEEVAGRENAPPYRSANRPQYDESVTELVEVRPGEKRWDELVAWLQKRKPMLDLVRSAADRPTFGFVLGPNGSQRDAPLNHNQTQVGIGSNMLISVLLPTLNRSRELALMLAADLRLAVEQKDGARALANLSSILAMADQLRNDGQGSFVVTQLLAMALDGRALAEWRDALSRNPELFDDTTLVAAAHRLSRMGKATPMIELRGERMFFHDVIQHIYTDDGAGDGRPTSEGMNTILPSVKSMSFSGASETETSSYRLIDFPGAVTAPLGLIGSRKDVVQEYDRLMDMQEAQVHRPAREADFSVFHARMMEIKSPGSLLQARYLPIYMLMPSLTRLPVQVDLLLGERDALVTVHALEIYRRREGRYPEALEVLVPGLLPAVPIDRINGGLVRYKSVDGKPLLYSLGADGDDDAGRAALGWEGVPEADAAAKWPTLEEGQASGILRSMTAENVDGDWVLFPSIEQRPKD